MIFSLLNHFGSSPHLLLQAEFTNRLFKLVGENGEFLPSPSSKTPEEWHALHNEHLDPEEDFLVLSKMAPMLSKDIGPMGQRYKENKLKFLIVQYIHYQAVAAPPTSLDTRAEFLKTLTQNVNLIVEECKAWDRDSSIFKQVIKYLQDHVMPQAQGVKLKYF